MRRRRFFACLFGLCLLGVAAVTHGKSAGVRWEPDQSFSNRLAPTVQVQGYRLQPPKSYRGGGINGPKGSKVYLWIGATRRDRTRPIMMVNFLPIHEMEPRERAIDVLSKELLSGWKRHKLHWQQTTPQQGQINGLTFIRVKWSGIEPGVNRKTQGFSYVGRDGDWVIQIFSQDFEPIPNQALQVAEASARTFQK